MFTHGTLTLRLVCPKFGSEPLRTRFEPEPNRKFRFSSAHWLEPNWKFSSKFQPMGLLRNPVEPEPNREPVAPERADEGAVQLKF